MKPGQRVSLALGGTVYSVRVSSWRSLLLRSLFNEFLLISPDLVTGSMILILSELNSAMQAEIGPRRIDEIWKKSQDTLKFLSRKHPEASQCATALKIIRRKALHPKESQ